MTEIKDMIGKVFTSVIATEDEMIFFNAEEKYTFYHEQDCCETVIIDDITLLVNNVFE